MENLQIVLAERPKDDILPGTTFAQKISPAPTEADLPDGGLLVEVLYLSLDPAMRSWLDDDRSYLPPVEIGAVMRATGACRVLASRNPDIRPGDLVSGHCGWQQYALLHPGIYEGPSAFPAADIDSDSDSSLGSDTTETNESQSKHKSEPATNKYAQDPRNLLGVFGITGITAWIGMTMFGDPKPGDLVVVSAAAGATGSIAGQIAKARGARVIGVAGGPEKCRWLVRELGFDQALDYKDPAFRDNFLEATKDHIDVYYDNVGGETLELALWQAKEFSRFVMCGMISQYNTSRPVGPRNIARVIQMRIRMQGFIVFDHRDRFPEARRDLARLLAQGRLRTGLHVLRGGLPVAEQGLFDLYRGINTGKLLVEVKNPDECPAKL